MGFPMVVGDHVVRSPQGLAQLVRQELQGRPAVRGSRAGWWLAELVRAGKLDRRLAVLIAGSLLEQGTCQAVCEGGLLAWALGEPTLAPLVLRALDQLDLGELLHLDPIAPGTSVEDVLLGAATRVCDLRDAQQRADLLARLRRAGLDQLEDRVLAAHDAGDPPGGDGQRAQSGH